MHAETLRGPGPLDRATDVSAGEPGRAPADVERAHQDVPGHVIAADVRPIGTRMHPAALGRVIGEHVGFAEPIGAAQQPSPGQLQPLHPIPLRAHPDPEQAIRAHLDELRGTSECNLGTCDKGAVEATEPHHEHSDRGAPASPPAARRTTSETPRSHHS